MFHFPFCVYPNLLSPFLLTALALVYICVLVSGHLPIFMWPDELSVYLIAPFLNLAHTVFPLLWLHKEIVTQQNFKCVIR